MLIEDDTEGLKEELDAYLNYHHSTSPCLATCEMPQYNFSTNQIYASETPWAMYATVPDPLPRESGTETNCGS